MHKIAIPLHRKGEEKRSCMGFNSFQLRTGNIGYIGAGHCLNFGHLADVSGNKVLEKVKLEIGRDYFIGERKKTDEETVLAELSFEPLILGESYYVFGQHSAVDPVSSFGIVRLIYSGIVSEGKIDMYTFRAPAVSDSSIRFSSGLSGSPVLNKYGEIVAIGTAISTKDPSLVAAVPLFIIKSNIQALQ